MHVGLDYAESKLAEAVEALATGRGDLRDRLGAAAFAIIAVQDSNFPEGEMLDAYRALRRELTMVKDYEAGHIAATLAKMRSPKTERVAQMFWDLWTMTRLAARA